MKIKELKNMINEKECRSEDYKAALKATVKDYLDGSLYVRKSDMDKLHELREAFKASGCKDAGRFLMGIATLIGEDKVAGKIAKHTGWRIPLGPRGLTHRDFSLSESFDVSSYVFTESDAKFGEREVTGDSIPGYTGFVYTGYKKEIVLSDKKLKELPIEELVAISSRYMTKEFIEFVMQNREDFAAADVFRNRIKHFIIDPKWNALRNESVKTAYFTDKKLNYAEDTRKFKH